MFNFVDKVGPPVPASFLNELDNLNSNIFETALTKALARSALTADGGWTIAQGGTGHSNGLHFQDFHIEPTAREQAAGVLVVQDRYAPGIVDRYGINTNPGVTDMTVAVTSALAAYDNIGLMPNSIYGVTSVTVPNGRHYSVFFNGSVIRGIATIPTACVLRLKANTSQFYDYWVDENFNENYTCGTWWYDPDQASQFVNIFGINHSYGRRGMIYGELPGSTSTGLAQSENFIYGWRTRGIQNPFYGNHENGVLQIDGHMIALNEEWPTTPTFDWTAARAIENVRGTVHWNGGEMVKSASNLGFAADLSNIFMQNVNIETTCPIRIVAGANVHIGGARDLMGRDDQSQYSIAAGVTGQLYLNDKYFVRNAGGAYSGQALVDGTLGDPSFEVWFNDTQSFEWRWNQIGADVKLVKGCQARFHNHRTSITVLDPNIYTLENARTNLVELKGKDTLGYSVVGWYSQNDFGTTTLTNSTSTGPTNYLAKQFQLAASGGGRAITVDETNLASIDSTAFRCRPAETYRATAQIRITAGTNVKLALRYYDLTGTLLSDVSIADSVAAITSAWLDVDTLFAVPAGAAYMGLVIACNASTAQFTGVNLRRA